MKNFLFEDMDNGGYFFVEVNTIEEAWDIVNELDFQCHYTGQIYTDTEAEILGYDTF